MFLNCLNIVLLFVNIGIGAEIRDIYDPFERRSNATIRVPFERVPLDATKDAAPPALKQEKTPLRHNTVAGAESPPASKSPSV